MSRPGVLRHIFTVGGLTACSRVLGLVREMLQSRLIGAGVEQSAFTLAFALPNMARKLFGEGALTAAFVPVFKGEVAAGDLAAARRLARSVMTLMLLLLGAVSLLAVAGLTALLDVPALAQALSPRAELTLRLVRILFPYMLFICGAAFGMGVLNALGRFAEGAFMPAFLNLVWIGALGLLCFLPGWTLAARVTFVSWAILFGGLAQLLFLCRCLRRRGMGGLFSLPALRGRRDEKVRLVWRNTAVGALGAGAVQLNCMLDQVLGQCAAPWAAGVIGYAERLMDLPLGVVGVAFGTVLLPTFSGFFAQGDPAGARRALIRSVGQMMFVLVPASAGLFVLAPEVTRVVYEGNAFDAVATCRVSRALAVYAFGLAFFGFQKALVPWFQAQKDMKTPLKVSAACVAVNAALNVASVVGLPQEWRHVGLAASTSLCAALGCALLLAAARRAGGPVGLGVLAPRLAGFAVAALAMAAALAALRPAVAGLNRVLALALLVAAGGAVYAVPGFAWMRFVRRFERE